VATHGGFLDGINIPLPEQRDRLDEIPDERPVVVACQKGKRGYNAAKILAGHGFERVVNLRGGWMQYHAQRQARQGSAAQHGDHRNRRGDSCGKGAA